MAQTSVCALLGFHHSPLTTRCPLLILSQRKQTRLSRRGIRNGFQLGILHAQWLGHLYFGAFQYADELEGVDDAFALVVVVGDDEDFAGAVGNFCDAFSPRRKFFGGVQIVVALMGRNGGIVGEPGVVAAAVKAHVADGGSGFGARLERPADDGLVNVAESGV